MEADRWRATTHFVEEHAPVRKHSVLLPSDLSMPAGCGLVGLVVSHDVV